MLVAGVDEVGRGPLAGPVVAAAVVFEAGYAHPGIKDSKKLSKRQREAMAIVIREEAVQWTIAAVGPKRIDQINIREASRLAMALAVKRVRADRVLVDGNTPIVSAVPAETVIGGDAKHVEIAAASIIAKVYRDNLMAVLDAKYPGYELARHAGYPTRAHKSAIAVMGPSRIHRFTFKGVREHVRIQPVGPTCPNHSSAAC